MSNLFRQAIAGPPRAPLPRSCPNLCRHRPPARVLRRPVAANRHASAPNPVVWFRPGGACNLVASQPPGLRVYHAIGSSGIALGQRLRDWIGVDQATFLRPVPHRDHCLMAFCFPGYVRQGR